eukprot:5263052-Pyramimonas_sp.AAC.2
MFVGVQHRLDRKHAGSNMGGTATKPSCPSLPGGQRGSLEEEGGGREEGEEGEGRGAERGRNVTPLRDNSTRLHTQTRLAHQTQTRTLTQAQTPSPPDLDPNLDLDPGPASPPMLALALPSSSLPLPPPSCWLSPGYRPSPLARGVSL